MKPVSMALALCLIASPVLAGGGMKGQQQGAATGSEYQGSEYQGGQAGQQQSQLSQVNEPEIRQIQQQLQQQGYDVGQVDGLWGPQSQQALRQWQDDQGFEPTGRIDQRTLAELGVEPESQTAETPPEQ